MWEPNGMVAHTGFEPVVSALRGRCPRPLDECARWTMAAGLGFEPRLTDSESAVLPLDDPASAYEFITGRSGPIRPRCASVR
jgi:hypothetical protein